MKKQRQSFLVFVTHHYRKKQLNALIHYFVIRLQYKADKNKTLNRLQKQKENKNKKLDVILKKVFLFHFYFYGLETFQEKERQFGRENSLSHVKQT